MRVSRYREGTREGTAAGATGGYKLPNGCQEQTWVLCSAKSYTRYALNHRVASPARGVHFLEQCVSEPQRQAAVCTTVPGLPVAGKLSDDWGRPETGRRAGCLAALRLVTGRPPGHIADSVLPLHLTTVRYLHL